MAFIEIHADPNLLRDLVAVLTRIAEALDRAYPVGRSQPKRGSIGPEHLIRTTDDQLWEQQNTIPEPKLSPSQT